MSIHTASHVASPVGLGLGLRVGIELVGSGLGLAMPAVCMYVVCLYTWLRAMLAMYIESVLHFITALMKATVLNY